MAGGAQGVEDLEFADQRNLEMVITALPSEDHVLAGRARGDFADGQILAAPADGHRVEAALPGRSGHAAAPLAVDIDHRAAAIGHTLGEQQFFGCEVIVEIGVIVEMVLGEVGEGAHGHADPVHAVLLEPVAGGLHCQMGHALPGQRVEGPVQGNGVGRGVPRHLARRAAGHAQRTETGGVMPGRRPDLAQEFHGGALAVGTGDGDDMPGLARMEARRELRQHGGRLVGHEDGDVDPLDSDVGQDHRGAPGDRLGNEVAPVGRHARQGGEKETRLDLAAVERQPAHLDGAVFRRERFIGHQLGEFHGIISGIRAARIRAARSPWSASARSTPSMGAMRDTISPTAGAAVQPPVA